MVGPLSLTHAPPTGPCLDPFVVALDTVSMGPGAVQRWSFGSEVLLRLFPQVCSRSGSLEPYPDVGAPVAGLPAIAGGGAFALGDGLWAVRVGLGPLQATRQPLQRGEVAARG
mmetsp:Transcript_103364/g.322107  ORF Transcript_103364/g.322107 Transcript_103364/m.322107 type:complete len:113 (-) Transcript_103364:146-484(-)